jgi:hypothetical protein
VARLLDPILHQLALCPAVHEHQGHIMGSVPKPRLLQQPANSGA